MFVRFTIDVLGVQYCQIKTDPNITRGWGPKTRSGLINIMIIRIDQSKHKSFDWKISSEWIQKSARPRERVKLNRQTYWIFRFISDLCVAATLFIICNWFLYSFHRFSTNSEQALWRNLSNDGQGVFMFYKWVFIGFTLKMELCLTVGWY